MSVREMAQKARTASRVLAVASTETRNLALAAIARAIAQNEEKILAANARDLTAGEGLVEQGELDMPSLKRLDLSGRKFPATVEMVHSSASTAAGGRPPICWAACALAPAARKMTALAPVVRKLVIMSIIGAVLSY